MLKKINSSATKLFLKVKNTLSNKLAEGYIDSGVKIIIAVVIGTLLLGILYGLFKTVIEPNITSKVTGLFNYQYN
ncbi:MAG: DUF6133 family protein [Clostridia bacterium]|nr:DUF6133 family protein [Clostridia bacterium]